MIAIDLSKQKELDANLKVIQKIDFMGNLNRGQNINDNTTTFSLLKKQKKSCQIFQKEL